MKNFGNFLIAFINKNHRSRKINIIRKTKREEKENEKESKRKLVSNEDEKR